MRGESGGCEGERWMCEGESRGCVRWEERMCEGGAEDV